MRITQTTSFWVVIITAVISFFIGQIHWILGVLFFLVIAGKSLFVSVLLDAARGALEYHHDRNDQRAKKEAESHLVIEREKYRMRIKE